MRNEVLRDVLAGCAGVLAVAAAIGLPNASTPAQQQARLPAQHIVLLPKYSRTGPPVSMLSPPAPATAAPHMKITTGP
jgi:hypothetical protein